MIDCSDMYWHFAANFEINLKFIACVIHYNNDVSTRVMQWLQSERVTNSAKVNFWWSFFQERFAHLSFQRNNQFLNRCHPAEICVHWLQNHKNFDKPSLKNLVYFSFVSKFTQLLGNNVQGLWIVQCWCRRLLIYCSQNSTNVRQVAKLVFFNREADWKEICHRVQEWSGTIINGERRMG
jgi:hypothetical protein